MLETIINVETGEITTVEMPESLKNELLNEWQQKQLEHEANAALTAEKAAAKAALLERLGITEDEAKLLLS